MKKKMAGIEKDKMAERDGDQCAKFKCKLGSCAT